MGLADLQRAIKGREDYLAGNKGSGGGGGGNFTYTQRIQFKEGQTKRVRFNGPVTEPIILRFHSFNEEFNPIICAVQFEAPEASPRVSDDGTYKGQFAHLMTKGPHDGCVFCFQYSSVKDKRIGFGRRAVYSVVDEEMYHAVPNERGATDKDGNLYVNDELCPNNGRCAYCRSPDPSLSERYYGGQKKWEMPMKSAMALMGQITVIQNYCACCWPEGAAVGVGIIQTEQYNCTNDQCGAEIPIDEYDPTVSLYHTCGACNQTMIPLETASCSNGCEGARRTTMWDGDWSVTRTGSSTLTSYSFHFLGVSEPQDWVLALEVPDLSAEEKPMNADKMAKKLGIANPFEHNRQQVPGHSGPTAAQRRPVSAGPAPALTGRQVPQAAPQAQGRAPVPQQAVTAPRVAPPVARPPVQRTVIGTHQAPQAQARREFVSYGEEDSSLLPSAPVRQTTPVVTQRPAVSAPRPQVAQKPVVAPPVAKAPLPVVRPVAAAGGGTQRAAIARSPFGPGKDDDIPL